MIKLKNTLEKILKEEPTFCDSESGELNYIKVKDSADMIDEKLISLLADNKELREKFFTQIKDVYVFNIQDFKFFLDESKVDNSYTKYSNKIGLADNSGLLENRSEVVLDFPFKDCILEGGQSTEEGTDTYFEFSDKTEKYEEKNGKRNEVFFNQVLAHDEIDRLYDRKALVNWKRFTKDSKKDGEAVKEIKRDKTGLIQENLIVKGNNLLALHSLKSEFTGKVKLIYIDPPYNTGSDSFAYNDRFNHSTWLTFMKNRLEVAKGLLREDGVIFCSINHIELAYLIVLMDGIFDAKNRLPIITLKAGTTASYRSINDCPVNVTEYVIAYSLKEKFKPNTIYRETGYTEDYSHFIENFEETPIKWNLIKITDIVHHNNGCDDWRSYKKKFGANWKTKRREEMAEFAYKNKSRVVSLNTLQKPSKHIQEAINKSKIEREKVFEVSRENNSSIYCYNGRTLAFFESKFREIEGNDVPGEVLTNIWDDISFLGIGPEGGVTLENGKKPEYLIKTIIELATQKGDIVLDYHLGTGTTCAVSHKMGRQYIGIEQLDYTDNDSTVRLQNVINGDKSGISDYDDVKWQGGGDFIYCELAKWNEQAKEEIQNAKDLLALVKLFDTLYERYFLNYNVKIKDFKEKIVKEEEFRKLTLAQQKKIFVTMLDLNQMYVNESEMADKKYGISSEDQNLTKAFYSKK